MLKHLYVMKFASHLHTITASQRAQRNPSEQLESLDERKRARPFVT